MNKYIQKGSQGQSQYLHVDTRIVDLVGLVYRLIVFCFKDTRSSCRMNKTRHKLFAVFRDEFHPVFLIVLHSIIICFNLTKSPFFSLVTTLILYFFFFICVCCRSWACLFFSGCRCPSRIFIGLITRSGFTGRCVNKYIKKGQQ